MMDEPIVSPKCLMGINDTLKIIEEKRQNLNHNLQGLNDDLLLTRIHECLDSCVCENGSSLFSYRSTLSTLKQKIEVLNEAVDSLKHKNGDDSYQEITEWIKYSLSMTKSYIDQIDSILPYSEEDLNAISHLLKEQGSQLFSKWQQLFWVPGVY
jgi:hypothetical protein